MHYDVYCRCGQHYIAGNKACAIYSERSTVRTTIVRKSSSQLANPGLPGKWALNTSTCVFCIRKFVIFSKCTNLVVLQIVLWFQSLLVCKLLTGAVCDNCADEYIMAEKWQLLDLFCRAAFYGGLCYMQAGDMRGAKSMLQHCLVFCEAFRMRKRFHLTFFDLFIFSF